VLVKAMGADMWFPYAPFPRKIYEFDSRGRSREASHRTTQPFHTSGPAQQATAWRDDGHKVVALIAQHYLTPAARKQVDAMLAADTGPLTPHDIASEAMWAGIATRTRKDNYDATKRWHFVDLEISNPDMRAACFGRKGSGIRCDNPPSKLPTLRTSRQVRIQSGLGYTLSASGGSSDQVIVVAAKQLR
jgi:hypothetical protein